MARVVRLKDLKIPLGSAVSNDLNLVDDYAGLANVIGIAAPAALDAATYTFEVSSDDGASYSTLTSDGTAALAVPIAGKSRSFYFETQPYKRLRIRQSIVAAADRIFQVSMQEALAE